jgi:hypothetical protein
MKIQNSTNEDAFESLEEGDFILLTSMLELINESGADWEEVMDLCFLGAAICAKNADMTPDDFMVAIRGIRVTENGQFGDA